MRRTHLHDSRLERDGNRYQCVVGRPVEQFLSVTPPHGLRSARARNLPLAGSAAKLRHVQLAACPIHSSYRPASDRPAKTWRR
jgi:hypothetical protein